MLVKNSNFHYQTEKFNYQKAKINCQKEIVTYLKKCKRKEEQKYYRKDVLDEYLESLNEQSQQVIPSGIVEKEKDVLENQIGNCETRNINPNIENKIEELEKLTAITFAEEFSISPELDLFNQEQFLYHGLRSSIPEGFKKLGGILEQKNILAGKYLEEYYSYSDNCNDGEYISLTSYNNSIEFQNFVRPYICLVINPFIEAYKTIYVPCEIWDYMKKRNLPLKNRYSYACNEYQAKDHISLDMVMAIGIPYFDILFQQGRESAKALTSSIRHLLAYHDLDIPIVDITCYNQVINPKEKQNVFQKK